MTDYLITIRMYADKALEKVSIGIEWLQTGLDLSSFPSQEVDAERKSLFVKDIIRYTPSRGCYTSQQPHYFIIASKIRQQHK
ncbi:hypothetical protein M440DRAFT_94783 [Trichoderma longibrachiatum ATCC 18648]|uniref:Uncharacterized protein n=1 Tax=Trichoderma longibrachiatum ATCC 18648 TaxID=983965 RepID=A0A2T4CJX5_TRILO|nr:hypothetical protein M440DRAFT_94783 [Trichoderma longibrachiatum ATCC 18648]